MTKSFNLICTIHDVVSIYCLIHTVIHICLKDLSYKLINQQKSHNSPFPRNRTKPDETERLLSSNVLQKCIKQQYKYSFIPYTTRSGTISFCGWNTACRSKRRSVFTVVCNIMPFSISNLIKTNSGPCEADSTNILSKSELSN